MPKQSKTTLYRFLEIVPALLTWLTFAGAIVFSYFVPFLVAIYIILFDLYWVLKAVNTAMHLFSSFSKLRLHANHDWRKRMESLADLEGYKKQLRKEILEASSRKNVVDLKHELFRLNKIDFTDRALDPRQIYHLVLSPLRRPGNIFSNIVSFFFQRFSILIINSLANHVFVDNN